MPVSHILLDVLKQLDCLLLLLLVSGYDHWSLDGVLAGREREREREREGEREREKKAKTFLLEIINNRRV